MAPVSRLRLRRLLQAAGRRPPDAAPQRPPGRPPPGDAALQALLRAARLADWLPGEADGLSPTTVALVAKHLARHRLREPRLLDGIAAFLLPRLRQLDAKVIQKLVFPFSRTNYRPSNHPELFSQLDSVLVHKAAASPLATVNILMSLFQLHHFPLAVLHKVFSPAFLNNVTSSPCGWIVRRYLSLLDMAVVLEVQDYDGPRLDPQYRVCMFDGILTADKANRKYSYKGLVAEALRQLVGEEGYRQNEVLPPGYCADFLLWISPSGSVLPPSSSQAEAPLGAPDAQSPTLDTPNVSLSRHQQPGSPLAGGFLLPAGNPHRLAPRGHGCRPREEPSPGTSIPNRSPCRTADDAAIGFKSSAWDAEHRQPLPKEGLLLPAASPGAVHEGAQKAKEIHRVVLSVNDQWHYCQGSAVLVGSRAMRDRHLRLLGYHLVQLPYMELEKVSGGVEGAKWYLCQKLRRLQCQV